MGEAEKCPKCGAKLRFVDGGYAKSAVNEGSMRGALPDSYDCFICGYYQEVFLPRPVVTPEEKTPGKKDYPDERKSLGEPGWLRTLVKAHYKTIRSLRMDGYSWGVIQKRLAVKEPTFDTALKTSICTSFGREMKARGDKL